MGRMTEEDRSLIFNLRVHKGWGSCRMMKEFPLKMWNHRTGDNIIKRIDSEGTTARKPGSGRLKSARTAQNVEAVSDLICSQEETPHSHLSPREIERHASISRSSIQRIVKKDLALKQYTSVLSDNG